MQETLDHVRKALAALEAMGDTQGNLYTHEATNRLNEVYDAVQRLTVTITDFMVDFPEY